MLIDYLNGNIHESAVIEQYKRNSREAEEFSMFGRNITDLISIDKETSYMDLSNGWYRHY
jgi:hypothetical protein